MTVARGQMNRMALLTAAALLACSGAAIAEDWPHWRGVNYDGISKEAEFNTAWPETGPKVLWRASVGTGFSSFSVSDGRVYTTGHAGGTDTLWCFDAAGGKVIWKHTYKQPLDPKLYEGGPSATPTVDGNRVYMLAKRGQLMCLNADDGKVIWERNVNTELGATLPKWGFASSPVIIGDRLIVNAGKAGMAFDKKTGKELWVNGTDPTGYASAVPFKHQDKQCVLIFGAAMLYCVQVDDGAVLWQTPWPTSYEANIADPVIVADDKIFISSGYKKGCALLKITPGGARPVWVNREMQNHMASTVFVNGLLFGMDERKFKCLDLNGEVKWSERSSGKGTVTVAGDKLIILSDKGRLAVATPSADGYKEIAAAKVLKGKCWTVPVLANGRIYCRNAKGDVVCLDVRKK